MDRIEVIKGDITKQHVDAIVNAANNSLMGGGGVDGAIHKAAGPLLAAECMELNGCPTGEARVTGAYNLPARWVIHTVGPVWKGGNRREEDLLANCYRNSLLLAVQEGARTIAFPSISTGAYGFPLDRAAPIAVHEIERFLSRNSSISCVTIVCFSDDAFAAYTSAMRVPHE